MYMDIYCMKPNIGWFDKGKQLRKMSRIAMHINLGEGKVQARQETVIFIFMHCFLFMQFYLGLDWFANFDFEMLAKHFATI